MSDDSIRVGYINDEHKHILVSIKRPSLTSQYPRPDIIQFAIEIERATWLHNALGEFLHRHGLGIVALGEPSSAMIDAGLEELMGHFPDSASGYDGRAVRAIFMAMDAAR